MVEVQNELGGRHVGNPTGHLCRSAQTHVRDDRSADLEEHRRKRLLGSDDERLCCLRTVHVEGADRVAALLGGTDQVKWIDPRHRSALLDQSDDRANLYGVALGNLDLNQRS